MSEPFTIQPAVRQGVIPLIGLWGATGGGKTNTALLLARGLAGATGKIGGVDTEHGRMKYYADDAAIGGFQHVPFTDPYSPERYLEALELLERSVDVGVLDSGTHLWEGPDGILDLHEQALDRMTKGSTNDWAARERLNWPAWREPKARYKTVRDKILRFRIPLIVCLRGEQKTRLQKVDGKSVVVTDPDTSPVFDRKFIFEMHVALEVVQKNGNGGYIKFTRPFAKCSHAEIRNLLPDEEKEQLGIKHGQALADWCKGSTKTHPLPAAANVAGTTTKAIVLLKRELWDMTEHLHNGIASKLEQWLWDEALLDFDVQLNQLSEAALRAVVAAASKKLKPQPATK